MRTSTLRLCALTIPRATEYTREGARCLLEAINSVHDIAGSSGFLAQNGDYHLWRPDAEPPRALRELMLAELQVRQAAAYGVRMH